MLDRFLTYCHWAVCSNGTTVQQEKDRGWGRGGPGRRGPGSPARKGAGLPERGCGDVDSGGPGVEEALVS
ncbi:hypothetical protein NCCP1664_19120 [Zafaria cholistanensis]|uniref:Uncharacterized protein n=1 Tax=Zafaria cholistanensis TaxID=1682741 RepID=A0A5A7NS05_9MICC|nr:hypothetical protein NCCP1664_19120 [Zafaria cholistanensis]